MSSCSEKDLDKMTAATHKELVDLIQKHQAGKHDQRAHGHAGDRVGGTKLSTDKHAKDYNKLLNNKNVKAALENADPEDAQYIKEGAALLATKYSGMKISEVKAELNDIVKEEKNRVRTSATVGALAGIAGTLLAINPVTMPAGLALMGASIFSNVRAISLSAGSKPIMEDENIRAYDAASRGEKLKWDKNANLMNKSAAPADPALREALDMLSDDATMKLLQKVDPKKKASFLRAVENAKKLI